MARCFGLEPHRNRRPLSPQRLFLASRERLWRKRTDLAALSLPPGSGDIAFRHFHRPAVIVLIALFQVAERQDREDVRRAELRVDHRAVAKFRPGAQVCLEQGRQRRDPLARIDRLGVQDRHLHAASGKRADAPFLVRKRMAMQKTQRQRKRERIDARQARAADQHVDTMMFRIDPKAAPQKLDDALRPVLRMDARAAEFQKALAGMAGQQRSDIEFRFAVKASVTCRGIPAKKTIDPNDFGLLAAETIALVFVNDEKMIAGFVERTNAPPCKRGALPRRRLTFFVKNLEPQPLRLADLPARRRQPDFKRTETPKHRGQAAKIAPDPVRPYEGGGVPDGTAETGRRGKVPYQPTNLILSLWIELEAGREGLMTKGQAPRGKKSDDVVIKLQAKRFKES